MGLLGKWCCLGAVSLAAATEDSSLLQNKVKEDSREGEFIHGESGRTKVLLDGLGRIASDKNFDLLRTMEEAGSDWHRHRKQRTMGAWGNLVSATPTSRRTDRRASLTIDTAMANKIKNLGDSFKSRQAAQEASVNTLSETLGAEPSTPTARRIGQASNTIWDEDLAAKQREEETAEEQRRHKIKENEIARGKWTRREYLGARKEATLGETIIGPQSTPGKNDFDDLKTYMGEGNDIFGSKACTAEQKKKTEDSFRFKMEEVVSMSARDRFVRQEKSSRAAQSTNPQYWNDPDNTKFQDKGAERKDGTLQMKFQGETFDHLLWFPKADTPGYNPTEPLKLVLYFHGYQMDASEGEEFCQWAVKRGWMCMSLQGFGPSNKRHWPGYVSQGDPENWVDICNVTTHRDALISMGALENKLPTEFGFADCGNDAEEAWAGACRWTRCKDSIAMVDKALHAVESHYCIDMSSIWATGCSNGGMFMFDLMHDERTAGRLAGVMPVLGLPPRGFNLGPVYSGIHFFGVWGRDDPVIPPIGRNNIVSMSFQSRGFIYHTANAAMSVYARANKCLGGLEEKNMVFYNPLWTEDEDTWFCQEATMCEGQAVITGCVTPNNHDQCFLEGQISAMLNFMTRHPRKNFGEGAYYTDAAWRFENEYRKYLKNWRKQKDKVILSMPKGEVGAGPAMQGEELQDILKKFKSDAPMKDRMSLENELGFSMGLVRNLASTEVREPAEPKEKEAYVLLD